MNESIFLSDQEDFQCANVIFCQFKIASHVWICGPKLWDQGRGGASSFWETGQLIFSMGLVWREVHTLAQKATTPRKVFFAFESTTY
jgi:hypothetical protein